MIPKLKVVLFWIHGLHLAFNKKSNLLARNPIKHNYYQKSLEISLNLIGQIKQLSLTHFVLIETEPNLETE